MTSASAAGLLVLLALGRSVAAQGTPEVKTTPLRFDARVHQGAISGEPVRLVVRIKNTGPETVYFSFDRPTWLPGRWFAGVSYGYKLANGAGGSSSGIAGAVLDGPKPGTPFCPAPESVFALAPGARLERLVEAELRDAPPGAVELTLRFELLRIDRDLGCAPPEFHRGKATLAAVLQRQRSRPGAQER